MFNHRGKRRVKLVIIFSQIQFRISQQIHQILISATFGWIINKTQILIILSSAPNPRLSNHCLLFVPCLLLTFPALILWTSLSNPNVTKGRIRSFTDEPKLRIRLRMTARLTVKGKIMMMMVKVWSQSRFERVTPRSL